MIKEISEFMIWSGIMFFGSITILTLIYGIINLVLYNKMIEENE